MQFLKSFCFALCLVFVGVAAAARSGDGAWAQETSAWQEVVRSPTVLVEVEKALYDRSGSDQFYVKVRVRNLTPGLVYVDLRSGEHTIYPNLWKVQDREGRGVVSEQRLVHEPLAGPNLTAFLQAAKDGKLSRILGDGTLEFYAPFKDKGRFEIDKATPAKFVLVSLDGHLFIAAGERFEMVALEWPTVSKKQTDLMVAWPVVWRRIPDGATVVTR